MSSVSAAAPPLRGSAAASLRIALTYFCRHGRLPDLSTPTRFTELVQLRKLHDRDARLPLFADKLGVKHLVADRLGSEWIVPTLWSGRDLPQQPEWPRPFVVKARHGCNQLAFVRTGREDWEAIRREAERWLGKRYGSWLDEWLYGEIERGLIVEPFIGVSGQLPLDYKFYVFDGRVAFVQVHLDREHRHRWTVLDRAWRPIAGCRRVDSVAPPASFATMVDAAEEMGRGFDFVRVDLYEPAGTPLFGEMSFYPGSGLDRFDPPELDTLMGSLWLAARGDVREVRPIKRRSLVAAG